MDEWVDYFHLKESVLLDDNHSYFLHGNDYIVDELTYRVQAGDMVFIEGAPGTGKTRLLFEIIRKFGSKRQVVYLDCKNIKSTVDIKKLLLDRYGSWNRILKKLPTKMIVLLDNINQLDYKNCERAKYYFDQNNIQSIIFTAEDRHTVQFSESLWQRIGKRIIQIPALSERGYKEIIEDRIGRDNINAKAIKQIVSLSNNNIKILLDNTRDILQYMEANKMHKISIEKISEILNAD